MDFRKALGTADRNILWKNLKIFGCLDKLLEIIRQFYEGTKGCVQLRSRESEAIEVGHGTNQGCVLTLTIFTLFLTVVLKVLH